ncbi:hypothetical protein [Xenorhabdus beddingii]|uniref:hypothetical protein n=1 Tax=Xenorhabdus beddingii TaxID=40578 RepID=UPI001428AAC1|nr:hypothetical protein [Xenorhabdus beddingii]
MEKITALDFYKEMTKEMSLWLRLSFIVRDKVSTFFGVKKSMVFLVKISKKHLTL